MCDFPDRDDGDDDITPPDCRWCVECRALFRMSEWDAHLSSVAHTDREVRHPYKPSSLDETTHKLNKLMDDVISGLKLRPRGDKDDTLSQDV